MQHAGDYGSLRTRLESGAASFDYEYFRLHDDESFELDGSDAEKHQARIDFSKARAMSALAFALGPDDSQLHEAIYESLFALGTPAELVRLIEQVLG